MNPRHDVLLISLSAVRMRGSSLSAYSSPAFASAGFFMQFTSWSLWRPSSSPSLLSPRTTFQQPKSWNPLLSLSSAR